MFKKINLLLAITFFLAIAIYPFVSAQVGGYNGNLEVGISGSQITIGDPGSGQACGNGVLEAYLGEQCDDLDLNGETCSSLLGSTYSGSLSCKTSCTFETSSCTSTSTGQGGGGGGSGNSGGGGGSSAQSNEGTGSNNCVENWECTDWSMCSKEGVEERICTDLNGCGTQNIKPGTTRSCELGTEIEESEPFFSTITGAVVGSLTGKDAWKPWLLILFILVALIAVHRQKTAAAAKAKRA